MALRAVLVLVGISAGQHTEKPLLLRVCLRSTLRRESRRFAGRSLRFSKQEALKSQRRIVDSGPHSPSKVGNARTADASTASNVPCPPQEESRSGNLSGRLTSPGLKTLPFNNLPGRTSRLRPIHAHFRRRSCEPFQDNKKNSPSQRFKKFVEAGYRAVKAPIPLLPSQSARPACKGCARRSLPPRDCA